MNAALFCTAAALPTNFFANLSTSDLAALDTLSYYLIRELICLRVNDAGDDFLVGKIWLPGTPLALQLWEIAASKHEVFDDGEHDLFRDVSEMMDILFHDREMLPPLVKGMFQPFVKLVSDGVEADSYDLQTLVNSDPGHNDRMLTNAPLVSFEIGTEICANYGVFSTIFGADSYIRALGKSEWVLDSAKAFLELLHAKEGKMTWTWQELAKFQTISSLFINNTRAVGLAKVALAAEAEAAAGQAHTDEATSRASSARRIAVAAAANADEVMQLTFLEGYNDGRDFAEELMPEIEAYGIVLAVTIAMERWGGRINEKKLRDGIEKNIPIELRELYPQPDILEDISKEAVFKLSPLDAVCLLANLFLREVEGKMPADYVETLYIQAQSQQFQSQSKRKFPLVCFPDTLKVSYKDEELDVVSAIDLHGGHFTTIVFSLNTSGGIQTTIFDCAKRAPKTKKINPERTIPNIVRVICARPSARSSCVVMQIAATSGEWCYSYFSNVHFQHTKNRRRTANSRAKRECCCGSR